MRIVFIILANLLSIYVFAQVSEKHDIDKLIDECTNNANDYKSKSVCYKLSLKKWDAEIEKYYKKLSAELYLDTKELIDRSQDSWKQYKKYEYEAIEDMLSQLKGDFYSMLESQLKMELVRNRALELKMLYEALHQP